MASFDYLIYCEGGYNKGRDVGSCAYVIVDCKTWKTREFATAVWKSTSVRVHFIALGCALKEIPQGTKVKVICDADVLTKVMSGVWLASSNLDLIGRVKEIIRERGLSVSYEWKSAKLGDPIMLRCWKICRDKLKEAYKRL